MLKNNLKQLSLYTILYDKIPKNHILKSINSAVDFSFINKLLESSYCKYYGRPAKEPEMMARLLILQYLYNLSDIQVIEDSRINLAYMWFIGINPDEDLPDASLLAKFRTQRLKDTSLDDIIVEVVRQCIEKGIIKGTGISVDCTHTAANTVKKVPERIMKHLAKKIVKSIEEENGVVPEGIDINIPKYKEIEDHKIAKSTMKEYVECLCEDVENKVDVTMMPKTEQSINKAREILDDPKFIVQKGIRSLVDEDARVGYKSKTDSFFGYKVEYAMVAEERIITAVGVHDGAYVDGTGYKDLYEKTNECGIDIKEAYGDKAYFRKPILDILEKNKVEAVIPVSESVYRVDESRYSYNKDSDQWFCECGNQTIEKRKVTRKSGQQYLEYRFDRVICRNCPNRKGCIKSNAIGNKLVIGLNAPEFYESASVKKRRGF